MNCAIHAVAFLSVIVVAGCATSDSRPAATVSQEDVRWLNRVTYGINSESYGELLKLGRARYLEQQLAFSGSPLPSAVATQAASLEISHRDAAQLLQEMNTKNKRINAMTNGPEKDQARKEFNERGNKLAYEAARRHLLYAVYSPAQLREQMTWFWLNHFNVQQNKANIRWSVGDYEERAIRPNALGKFRDLVLATLSHPAMIQYLDNAQNSVNHLNENYARELMELHTLGVDAEYTQHDVQELARVLTGVGINFSGDSPTLKPEWQPLYRRVGAFEFNPARHDFAAKTLLGRDINGHGFDEVEHAVDILTKDPHCARFVARKLAVYFVADDPPQALIDKMAKSFQATDGDIGAVVRVLISSTEFSKSLGGKFKDPMHFVVSAVRLAYDARPIVNMRPVVNWLNALGEPLYGKATPNGYPLTEGGWASSGQLSRRFEIARSIGFGNSTLFEPEDEGAPRSAGFPLFTRPVYFDALEPLLSKASREALNQAMSQQEWNTFLLASPEFNYR